jgi:glycosyltransferase involved in cell wall biosynthesis
VLSNQRVLGDPAAHEYRSPPRPAKVWLMIGQLGLGGTEKQVVLLARGLRDRGIGTAVLTLFEGGPREQALRDAGVPCFHLGFSRLRPGLGVAGNAAAFARLVRLLRREQPDVLHAFLLHSYLMAAPAAWLARVPVLVAGRRSMGDFKQDRRMVLRVERLATRTTDLLIANAHVVAEDTRERERVPAEKIAVVYNGLPGDAFTTRPPARIDTGHPVLLCVANLKAYKGHQHLLEAVKLLHAGGRPCTLVLAGDGGERRSLERQARQLSLDVRFRGTCTDVGPLLARADVVVLPSLHEGMSNAVMEAMAAGRPVVATAVGGTPELLRGRGILVPPGDPAALAAALGPLLADPGRRASLGAAARQWSRSHLSADAMVDEHVRIYSDLLELRCAA